MRTRRILLLILITQLLFVSCVKQEQIDELNLKLDNVMEEFEIQLNNQTSLLYKTIGEQIPVVVPKESQDKLNKLLASVNELSQNLNDETLNNSVGLYLDYIKNTAPWIQEEKSDDIFFSKYSIDYYTILNNYKNNNDISEVTESLQNFILSSGDYKNINIVIETYNSLVDELNKLYQETVTNLNSRMESAFSNSNITFDELMQILASVEPYIEEPALEKNIQILDNLIIETDTLNQITEDLNNLNQLLSLPTDEILQEQMVNIYMEQLALNNYKLNQIKHINHEKATALLLECTNKIKSINIEQLREQELLKQIKESLVICNNEITNLSSDSIGSSMISILSTQLATLKFNANSLSLVSNVEVLADIEKSISLLNRREKEISQKIMNSDTEVIKKYNKKVLGIIENVNNKNNEITMFDENKKTKKISLLLELEEIETNYLYLSIGTLYQQVYQEIWSSLDSESKFIVSKESINIQKKGIYE